MDTLTTFDIDSDSKPFEILRVGEWVKSGRPTTITEADLDQAVANFEAWQQRGAEVSVDYDHGFHERGDSRAAGWIKSLVRRGQSLFAQVSWTAIAAEMIRKREYRAFSAEFDKNWTDEEGQRNGFTILAGALTNRPFLRGMTHVALSQQGRAELAETFTAEWRGRDDVCPEGKALNEKVAARMGERGIGFIAALDQVAAEETQTTWTD